MENMDKKCEGMCGGCKGSCQGGCGSCCDMGRMGGCGCHRGGRHLLKMVLKIVIVLLIFSFGFKLGVMTGFIQAQYGHGIWGGNMMRGYNNSPSNVPNQ